jgi:hypothetical protein
MSFSRNYMTRYPYYTYKDHRSFGNGMNGMRLLGAAASPTALIVVGTNTAFESPYTSGAGSVMKISTDGIIWSNVTSTSFGSNGITQIAYGNDVFVAMGASNLIATSPGTSGTTWTQRTSPASGTNPWGYLTFQNGYFIACNGSTGIFRSTDGITWSAGASITVNAMTTWLTTSGRSGGIFYIENNPSTARWLQVYGQLFSTTTQTHFALFQDITSSGTASSSFTRDNSGSYGAQWIPEDNRLIVSVAQNTTAGFSGHASSLHAMEPTSTESSKNFPDSLIPAGVFFPSVLPVYATVQIGSSTASTPISQYADLVNIGVGGSGAATTKKSLYVYNDGYYNCLYVTSTAIPANTNYGGIIHSPTANVVFRSDDPSYAESVQLIGPGVVPQAGVTTRGTSVAAGSGGFERAIDVKFKGDSYVFFVWFANSNYWNIGYMRGTRSIKPLRTTIGPRV